MLTVPNLDGSLATWSELRDAHRWSGLLIGNGLSINVWPRFGYDSLYSEAIGLGGGKGLEPVDQGLFEALATQNFERVLGDLDISVRVVTATNGDPTQLLACYQNVQRALGDAVRSVHVPWNDVPKSTLEAIQTELRRYKWVFSTSYDLLVYWAMAHNDDYRGLVDVFWNAGNRFDLKNIDVRPKSTPVYFPHGAMHLLAEGSGRTRKLTRTGTALLDQFGEPIQGDPEARPLLVTEGSSRDKLRAIESNDYLSHAYTRLQNTRGPIVVFGSSLSDQDLHLCDALSRHPDRPVAVAMLPGDAPAVSAAQRAIVGRLEADPLLFFDATTHPLGDSALRVQVT